MNTFFRISLYAVFFCISLQLYAGTARAQSELDGAWEIIEVFGYSEEDGNWREENPQPGIFLFQDGYYSMTYVRESRPLVLGEGVSREELTAEQAASVWLPYESDAGWYEISESQLLTFPMVSVSPNLMEGGTVYATFSIDDDILSYHREGEGFEWTIRLRRL